jgi:four helix bundle protein
MFKFEKLEIYQLALDYVDRCYALSERLPDHERYNLVQQLRRAATSVVLNIAEGSTGQSDPEQTRFLGMALRSLLETVACQQLIRRRGYLDDVALLTPAYQQAETLARRIQAMRRAIMPRQAGLGEEEVQYAAEE